MESFPYQPYIAEPTYGDDSEFVWRPMLLVSIFGLSDRLDTIALVDTGAPETIIPLDFWPEVEPAFRDGEEGRLAAANGSEIGVKYGTVDLAVRLGGEVFRWSTKVDFTTDREEMVLGDLGFLRFFRVTFDRAVRRLTVHRPVDLPPSFIRAVPTGDVSPTGLETRRRRRKRPRPKSGDDPRSSG